MGATPYNGIPWYGPGVDDATAAMIARNASATEGVSGGGTAPGSDPWLIAYSDEDDLQFSSVSYDSNQIISSATVHWPDGVGGTWTTTSASELGLLGYTVSYQGSPPRTVTVSITRNANGQGTNVTRSVA